MMPTIDSMQEPAAGFESPRIHLIHRDIPFVVITETALLAQFDLAEASTLKRTRSCARGSVLLRVERPLTGRMERAQVPSSKATKVVARSGVNRRSAQFRGGIPIGPRVKILVRNVELLGVEKQAPPHRMTAVQTRAWAARPGLRHRDRQ